MMEDSDNDSRSVFSCMHLLQNYCQSTVKTVLSHRSSFTRKEDTFKRSLAIVNKKVVYDS